MSEHIREVEALILERQGQNLGATLTSSNKGGLISVHSELDLSEGMKVSTHTHPGFLGMILELPERPIWGNFDATLREYFKSPRGEMQLTAQVVGDEVERVFARSQKLRQLTGLDIPLRANLEDGHLFTDEIKNVVRKRLGLWS